MTPRPPLLDVLGARWVLGSPVTAVAWSAGCAGFALADGTVALAPAPWQGAPALRPRGEGGGVEVVPARGPPPPLARVSVSRGPCRALAGAADGFLSGATDGRLRRLSPDGKIAKAANFNAPVDAVAATAGGAGWACVAGGRVHGDPPPPPGAAGLAGVAGLAWHPAAGLAVAHPGGVALCRGPAVEPLPGGAPTGPVLAFSPDGRWLAGGSALWRLSPSAPALVALPGLSGPPAAAAFSAEGDLLALAGPEDGVRLWRLADGAASPVAGGWHSRGSGAAALAFHPRRPLLAAAYANGAVLLGPPGGDDAVLLRGASGAGGVGALAFAADGAWLAAGSAEGECALVALPDLLFRAGETQPPAGVEGGVP